MGKTISVIIPVCNEASVIGETLDRLFETRGNSETEVIVVDGSPRGDTINAIQRSDVTTVVSGKGRSRQMNTGARHAGGVILLFLHADTILPVGALDAVVSAVEGTRNVAGAFDLGIRSERLALKVIARAASLRSRITKIPYGDQAIFIRKDYFNVIGGFREMPLMEDVDLMRRIKKRGDAICILPDRVMTSPRRWEMEGILYCTLRNWALITLFLLGVPPEKLVRFYRQSPPERTDN